MDLNLVEMRTWIPSSVQKAKKQQQFDLDTHWHNGMCFKNTPHLIMNIRICELINRIPEDGIPEEARLYLPK
ncbi:hypothetical protein YC2023_068665 [Brassica napus]